MSLGKWHTKVAKHSAVVVVFCVIGLRASSHAFLQSSLYAVACKCHQVAPVTAHGSVVHQLLEFHSRFDPEISVLLYICCSLYLTTPAKRLPVPGCHMLLFAPGLPDAVPGLGCILPCGLWSRFQSGLWPWASAFLSVSQVL